MLNADKLDETDCISSFDHADIDISVSEDNKNIFLSDKRREMSLPMSAKKTVDLIFKSKCKQRIGDFDDDIDWESRKLVVSKLITEGFVHRTQNREEV